CPGGSGGGVVPGLDGTGRVSTGGEPVMLAALIRNLLDNALRFTPEGGRVDVWAYPEGETAVLRIEDTGPGVPVDELDRIFEPFFRGVQPGGDGSGLGLSIVKRIVDRLGGALAAGDTGSTGRGG